MTLHTLNHERVHRPAQSPTNSLMHLGWPHFWLLIAILGGMLGLVVLVIYARLSTA